MDKINIIIRVMPNADEFDVELPVLSSGKEIVQELRSAGVIPDLKNDGEPFIYELISKSRGVKIEEEKTLYDRGIQPGEIIYIVPKIVPA